MDQLCKTLDVEPTTHQKFVLCQKCYTVTYQTFSDYRRPRICSSCGAIPKTGKIFNWQSPNAKAVTQHLKVASHDTTITPTDCLCFGCYKMHCTTMETLKSTDTDDMFKHDIEKWVNKL